MLSRIFLLPVVLTLIPLPPSTHFQPDCAQATVEELYRKQVTIEGNEIQLELLDTAGQEEMRDALQDQVGSRVPPPPHTLRA